jgi:hypothetical protein
MMSQQNDESQETKPLCVGDVVSLPAPRHNEYSGTIGTVAGQVYPDPSDQVSVCLVSVRGDIGPHMVFAVSDLQPLATAAAIAELVTQWGYRDVTELIKRVNAQLDAMEQDEEDRENGPLLPSFDYLHVVQTPEGGPVYCRQEQQLFKELDKARRGGHHYEHCPAPDPVKNIWMIIGNFDLDEDEEEAQA